MAPEKQHVESMEELVFKNRNKEYGAYYLRMKYRKYVTISLIIGLVIIGALVTYPVIASYLNKNRLIKEETSVETEVLNMPKEELPPPPPPPPPPEALEQKVKFTAPKVVNDTVETGLQTQDELANKPSTELPPPEEEIKVEETKKEVIEQPSQAEIFTVVEEQPSYPGGEEARIKFLQDNIKYPEEAKELGVQGKVFVTFVVEVDGSITDVKVLRGIGAGCDEEAIRVVKSMPKWVPGKQRGVPVRVQFNLPIKFTLQ
ncbi:MAG TPA: TonB family protein [Bacteroidales bacterium]|nr:TonB family protein [Bacteroidales bacterium]